MSFITTIGTATGKAGAYIVQGTALGASEFGRAAKQGYVSKAEELRAKRIALAQATQEPPVQRQRKLRTAAA